MGDVYKARDTRLDRTVAVKIVRADFSERFEREARSISALNHPHICTLHDVGRQDGTAYLVMEFVDGAPIAGPLPIADVLTYGAQICDALEAAHRKSIVHRDLKPSNILATRSGIKLLDFGLAKLRPDAQREPGNEVTVAALTGAHTIVGTPQYMAPEQIEGREADARTDIFALGCVLYELITGKRAFDGKTASSVMAAVLATEPRRIAELAPVTPATLDWVVMRCLAKDPDARWQSARDVALQLQWVADHPDEAAGGRKALPRRALLAGLGVGVAVTGIAAAFWMWTSGPRDSTAAPVSLSIQLPPKVSLLTEGSRQGIALSPDGRTVAFTGVTDDASAIFLRSLDRFDAVKVAGTEGGFGPFFSPNGQWIGFAADGQLKKVPTGGGSALFICDAPGLRGSVWLADDTIVFSPSPTGPLMRVPAGGGTPTPVTKLDGAQHEKTHRTLIGLPGGKAVVFVIGSDEIGTYDEARIVALTLDTGKITELVKGGYSPLFSPSGHLLYVHKATVFAVPFDPVTLKTSGSPVQVLKDVATMPYYGTSELDVSSTGVLIYAPGGDRTNRIVIHWVDRQGKITPIPAAEQHYTTIDVSPDGHRLAVGVGGANNVQWAYDLERDRWTRLTFRFDVEGGVWTHKGSRVTYWTGSDVRSVAADGSGSEDVLIPASEAAGRRFFPESWSADDQLLSITVYTPGKGRDVALYSSRTKKVTMIVESRYDEYAGKLSPDGKWLAFTSNESTPPEVYVRPTEGSSAKVSVSGGGGVAVGWTTYGRELLYASPQGLMAVPFTAGPTPILGNPEVLFAFEGDLKDVRGGAPSPDGKRFALLIEKPRPPLTEIRVVTNWTQQPVR